MKVTHSSKEMLIIDHVPWLLSIGFMLLILLFVGIGLIPLGMSDDPMWYLFSFLFVVVGGGLWLMALELFARRLQFVFDRTTDRISIRRKSIFTRTDVTHKLSHLTDVRIEQSMSENGQALQRPVLILESNQSNVQVEKRVPLHKYYTSGKGPEQICQIVNAWLNQTRGSRGM